SPAFVVSGLVPLVHSGDENAVAGVAGKPDPIRRFGRAAQERVGAALGAGVALTVVQPVRKSRGRVERDVSHRLVGLPADDAVFAAGRSASIECNAGDIEVTGHPAVI